MTKNREISESLNIPFDSAWFSGDLDDVINNLISLKEQCLKFPYDKYILRLYSTGYDYEELSVEILGIRLETDEEMKNRLKKEREQKKYQEEFKKLLNKMSSTEAAQFLEYKKLKQKFEKES